MSAPAGAAEFRAWRRGVGRREPVSVMQGGGYAAYVVVIAAGIYGSMLWSYLTSLELGGAATWSVGRVALLVVGALAVGGAVAARTGVPLWVSRREATFALGGQFRPRVVLRRRSVAVLLAASALGAFAAAAAASGGGTAAATATWALWGAAAGAVPVGVAAAAQARAWRRGAGIVAGTLLAVGAAVAWAAPEVPVVACQVAATAAPAHCGTWADTGPGVPAVIAAVGATVAAWWTVLRAVPARIDVDDVATRGSASVGVGHGMAAGDLRAAASAIPVRYSGSRRMLTSPAAVGLTRRFPVVARDLVGQRRRPIVTTAGIACGTLGAWLVATARQPAAVAAGALLLYYAAGATSQGLTAFYRQPVRGGLLPGSGRRVLGAHLTVPVVAALLTLALGRSLADVLGQDAGASGLLTGWCVAVVAVVTRAGSATGATVPPALYTPISTPLGDFSVAVVGAYYVRGWLVTAGAAWLIALPLASGGTPAWLVAVAVVAVLGGIAVRRADRN